MGAVQGAGSPDLLPQARESRLTGMQESGVWIKDLGVDSRIHAFPLPFANIFATLLKVEDS